jgi:hypothetical protein
MERPLPVIGRVAFGIHVIAAMLVGLPLLADPLGFGATFGYLAIPESQPVLRAFGAMILAFGGLTSFFGLRSPTWQHVDYIVRGEMAYLSVQTLVFALSALVPVGPALANWIFAALSAVLFVLFAATFAARPKPSTRDT